MSNHAWLILLRYPYLVSQEVQNDHEDHGYHSKLTEKDKFLSITNPNFSDLTANERAKLAHALGKYEHQIVLDQLNTENVSKKELMEPLNLDCLLTRHNPTVVNFVAGVGNKPYVFDTQLDQNGKLRLLTQKEQYHLYKTVESILNFVDSRCLLPLHLQESLVLYTSTGSKMALQITNIGSAHGSYKMVRSILEILGSTEPKVPIGDCIAVFDNNQIINRPWRVKLGAKYVVNIVTMVVLFEINQDGLLQHQEHLIPAHWSRTPLTEPQVQRVKVIDQCPETKATHEKHLNPFLSDQLKIVVKEQKWLGNKWQDCIDTMVHEQRKEKLFQICHSCKYEETPHGKRNCIKCNKNLRESEKNAIGLTNRGTYVEKAPRKFRTHEDRVTLSRDQSGNTVFHTERQIGDPDAEYTRFPCKNADKVVKSNLQKPIFENPCSYPAVVVALQGIGERGKVKQYLDSEDQENGREWLAVYCDGVPYDLSSRILRCCFRCRNCNSLLYGTDMCQEHEKETGHSGFDQEFRWLLLKPGPGHIEMNMLKALVELLWEVFWKEMVKIFNFTSEAALKSAKKVGDHHKGMTLARIARQALTRELLVPYVRMCLSSSDNTNMSPAHFLKFVMSQVKNKTYLFIADITFELMDSMFLYHCGIRCGDQELMDAGRNKFAKVWYGRRHPMYRELEMSDTFQNIRLPEELKEFIADSLSLNTKGRPYTGQGPDFRCEEENKDIQQILPQKPSGNDWNIACGGRDEVLTVRKNMFQTCGVQDPKIHSKSPQQNIDEEIKAFRSLLRDKEYLLHPLQPSPLLSLSGEVLDDGLLKFCSTSRDIRKNYVDAYIAYESDASKSKMAQPKFSCKPIFVTKSERAQYEELSQQSPACIKKRTESKIGQVKNSEMKDTFQRVLKEDIWVLNSKKQQSESKDILLAFYYEVSNYVEDEEAMSGADSLTSEGAEIQGN